jgi:hypothetical protein
MRDRRADGRGGVVLVLALGLMGVGCAHRRQVFYPGDYGGVPVGSRPKVHVRAPFVDVQVREAPTAIRPAPGVDDGTGWARGVPRPAPRRVPSFPNASSAVRLDRKGRAPRGSPSPPRDEQRSRR